MEVNIKEQKGITLLALALTIVISLLLIISISTGFISVSAISDYYEKKEDILALTKAVQSYYLKNGELPLKTKIRDLEFNDVIKNYKDETGIAIDRNPNDNDIYYVLYTGSRSQYSESTISNINDSLAELLPEVNIKSRESTYIVNKKSLTVYCVEGYELDGKIHYTAFADSTGGKFASEYYEDIGIVYLSNLNIMIDTQTLTNINESEKVYSEYAEPSSTISIAIDLDNIEILDTEGNVVTGVTFDDFDEKPNINSFRMTITDMEGDNIYVDSHSATYLDDSDSTFWVLEYNLCECGLNVNDQNTSKNITFSFDRDNDFYYNESNKIDYDMVMTNYFKVNRIELKSNEEEK